jgi:hypothetical protein
MRVPLVCRVCGIEFTAPRFDAKTCSSTCRTRLRRGGDLAYLNDPSLGKRVQRTAREMHAAYDALRAAHRASVAATRAARAERRKLRERSSAGFTAKNGCRCADVAGASGRWAPGRR